MRTIDALRPLLVTLCLLLLESTVSASTQIDPECDTNNDDVVDGFVAEEWDEELQQANLLNFFGVSMSYSPLQSPAALDAFQLTPRLELANIPYLDCLDRAVFDGRKTENTNKSPLFPRLRLSFGLPLGFYLGATGVPPVKAFGVTTGIIGLEAGYGTALKDRIELGVRASITGGRVEGDLAGPFEGQQAEDDIYRSSIYAAEINAGYRFPVKGGVVVPYLGGGFTRVIALMYVGESLPDEFDETDPNQAVVPTAGNDRIAENLYAGPHFQVGAQARFRRINAGLELFMVPLGFRFFASPRLVLGYTFF